MQTVAKYFDNRTGKTILVNLLSKDLGITDRETMISKIYSGKIDIASIAKLVIESAAKGDSACKRILDNEIKEVLLHIKALPKFIQHRKIKLVFAGGIASKKNYFTTQLKKEINRKFNNITLAATKQPPEIGAVLIAKKILQIN